VDVAGADVVLVELIPDQLTGIVLLWLLLERFYLCFQLLKYVFD